MSELQATIEFSIELCKFYNVDLFQRGLYQVRCGLRVPPKQPVQTEVSIPESGKTLGSASVLGNGGACRPFQILYRNEEVSLQDMILFRCHMLVDSRRLRESLERAEFSIVVELWFSEQPHSTMTMVSTRTLQLNFSPAKGLHYHLPVLFDYFHLSAVALTIHATLVALHQPYINTPRSAKPWLGGSKFRSQTITNTSMESVFQSGTKCGGSSPNKFAQARALHQHVCEVLLEAHQSLQASSKELLLLLPQWQQVQSTQHRNAAARLKKLCDSAKLLDAEEDFTARANSDVAQLCAENIVQWQNFLTSVSGKPTVHQHLAKKHHTLRVRRFAEAFFVVDNPRHSAAGCYDANYQNYLAISELARRSKYLVTLPPLPVHCVALDGDQTTMPIIFEDQYQDTLEFARRRSVAVVGRKSGSVELRTNSTKKRQKIKNQGSTSTHTSSPITDPDHLPDPFLSSAISNESSPVACTVQDKDDCSCGISAILESRSQSRTGTLGAAQTQLYGSGHTVQGTMNITPHLHHHQGHRAPAALPARHSKSLDQLKVAGTGQFATLPTRGSVKEHDDRRKNNAELERNGCIDVTLPRQNYNTEGGRRRLPYASRSTVDLVLRRDSSPPPIERPNNGESKQGRRSGERVKSPRKQYDFHHQQQQQQQHQHQHQPPPPRPLSEPQHSNTSAHPKHHHCRSSDESERRRRTSETCPDASACPSQFPRSNSTQIFPPNRQELDRLFHHSTLILSRNKDRPTTPNYRSDPERRRRQIPVAVYPENNIIPAVPPGYGTTRSSSNNTAHQRPAMSTFPRHGQSHNQTNNRAKCGPNKEDHTCPKNSSISGRYKLGGSSSREPIVTSSSTDSESLPNGHNPPSNPKRLHTSASVPHHLAREADVLRYPNQTAPNHLTTNNTRRHARSASSVLEDLFPLASTASESLPNLAQPDQLPDASHPKKHRHRRQFSGGTIGLMSISLSVSTSASTSSLTSERSGWVSSHSASEISSPEPAPLEISTSAITPNGPPINGEQLRTKLFELAGQQHSTESRTSGKLKHSSYPRNANEGQLQIVSDVSEVLNGTHVDNVDVTIALLDDDKEFIANIYGFTGQPDDRDSGLVKVQLEHPYIKKELTHVSLSGETSTKDSVPASAAEGYEEVRLPPPKQFRDVPLPPEPFRDPSPGPGPGTKLNMGTGPSPAIDNLLYHVYESIQDDIKKSHSNTDLRDNKLADKIEDFLATTEEIQQQKLPTDEVHQLFAKAREEFKSQLNFSGLLYSDLSSFASTLPYFHISDEYRIFSPEGMHLIVCVHGLDGNSADLRLVKTYLELGLPGAHLEFLMSERNQGDTFSDFDTMTDRLVGEILYHMESCGMRPSRISFVGHSLGNIIIRSALTRPQMKPLLSRLHTFLSLSGPHLGTLYNSSGLVNMGMWFMQKWKKSGSLLQLCLRDATDVRQSFLYRLSQRSTLHHFKNVLLCGSSQDRYVPLHSARLELCKAAIRDTTALGSAYREMVHNVVSPMLARRELTLVRYDVHHALPHTANALIGRAAHIAVLDSELFIEKFLVVAGLKYFR